MTESQFIYIKGAREHNLKNIDLKLPRNKLVVITGLSGSGKSSLAFDTIYAEGQRRYVESLSAYARQFLGLMEKPDVDFIEGLSPAISIEQKGAAKNPRSTVGTVTEIYDYLRLLFARIGVQHCVKCGRPITRQTVEQIVDSVLSFDEGARLTVMAPLVQGRKGEHKEIIDTARREGFVRLRIDGNIIETDSEIKLAKTVKHTIEVVIDRLVVKKSSSRRLADSVETALKTGSGIVIVNINGKDHLFSEQAACVQCGISYEELTPRMFSFNSPFGACPTCSGLGNKMEIDPNLVIPDKTKSINQGAIHPWGAELSHWYRHMLRGVADHYKFKFSTPFKELAPEVQKTVLYGSGKEQIHFEYEFSNGRGSGEYTGSFEGVIPHLERRYRQTNSAGVRQWIEQYMSVSPCPDCQGSRLKPEALAVIINRENIDTVTAMSVKDARRFFENLKLSKRQELIARQILKEIKERLSFMDNVGLNYLTLGRATSSLSGGESQRIRLATQIGSRLVGVMYILDEPSIGLHQRDNHKLLKTLVDLRDLGNTVIVVEHDRETIEAADYVVDLGPGAGNMGGKIVCIGVPDQIKKCRDSLTGEYLSHKKTIAVPENRRRPNGKFLTLKGATGNNLKSITANIPLGVFTVITGVSGSGKSTLINETLYRILARKFYGSRDVPLTHESIEGLEHIDKVVNIDQSPIGRTPRSNPATYTGVFTFVRDLFAQLPEARMRGYQPGRFSFNVKGGRCEACQGDGILKIEMHFLPDVYVPCEVCKGKRFNRETLEITFKGKSIADTLDMTVDEALVFFEHIPRIKRKLITLKNVGLGYIHLGQQATTLSGGEAQRVKLSAELSKTATGSTLYILDEPTTGLHFEDIRMLLGVLNELVERGNSVLVIEHNLDVIKTADHIIDMGPDGGDDGGRIIALGTPEEVAKIKSSYTGQYLARELNGRK
ncbi:ATPase and DNA damage recognition protein of nucleotide excision repair excinuclease UvrABC [Candidatus Zixiibacteriota bacterium]|nr:ATPase and DNA damage recognition protein of nucleotide excision repair excinuclease UvrABC [candidate division Zixibacteria bacterium]